MTLIPKLEAVIYAAEEPVTLAQLAALFAEEALAFKAEQTAAAASLAAESAQLGLNPEEITETPAADEPAETVSAPAPESDQAATPETDAPADSTDLEQEAKRLARIQDREVRDILRGLLNQLIADYASAPRGIEIREIAGGYRMATKPEYHDAVRSFVRSLKPALKLSLPALETLAVIAYKQPVTAPEVGEIRGVDSSGVLGSLMARKLITTAGRKQVIGRPILYKTTKEFLLRFGLKDISELPSMEEFEKLAAMELSETEEPQEESAAEGTGSLFAAVQEDSEIAGQDAPAAEVADTVDETASHSA